MIHDEALRSLGVLCLGLACGAFAACAGTDRPEPSEAQAEQIAAIYVTGGGMPTGGAANAGGSGGAPSGGGAGGGGAADACEPFTILSESCDGSGCHGAGSDIGNFAESIEDAELFAGLDPVTEACADYGPVLDPENPAQSLLVQKVDGSNPPCGNAMPLGPAPLTDDEVDCLVEWIGTL